MGVSYWCDILRITLYQGTLRMFFLLSAKSCVAVFSLSDSVFFVAALITFVAELAVCFCLCLFLSLSFSFSSLRLSSFPSYFSFGAILRQKICLPCSSFKFKPLFLGVSPVQTFRCCSVCSPNHPLTWMIC